MAEENRKNGKRYGIIAACAVLALALIAGAYWMGRSAGNGADIGEETAKLTALGHAQVSEDSLTRYGISRDRRGGEAVYEVEFTADGVEYDYEISAADGSIVKFQKELDNAAAPVETPAVTEPVSQTPAGDIGEARAWEIAYGHASVAAEDAAALPAKRDYENGVPVYELEFSSGGYAYDYEISAADGSVLKFEKESVPTAPNQAPAAAPARVPDGNSSGTPARTPDASGAGDIGEERAWEIAYGHAGVAAADVTASPAKVDYENGVRVYELEFFSGGYEYDYEINAADGSVIKFERERDDRAAAAQTPAAQPSSADTPPSYIGEERAREIAYAHAGVAASAVGHCAVELDHHDGHGTHHGAERCAYEIDFKCGGYEYDYEVDALTGEILKSQREVDD